MKKDITLKGVTMPDGYEETGEFRVPLKGEYFYDLDDDDWDEEEAVLSNGGYLSKYLILRKIEPEQPQYKAFEMDWSGSNPCFEGGSHSIFVGLKIGNYRIFGFGDDVKYSFGLVSFYSIPCDAKNNYKYAYGRLEK